MNKRIFTREEIQKMYDGLASSYDLSMFFFKIAGFKVDTYRKKAIQNLHLEPGDTVVDLGCGTGLNFSLLQEKVGVEGKIIGVDLSVKMLEQAESQANKKGWDNIELLQSDMAEFQIPDDTDGVLSTMAITMSPEYDQIIQKIATTLEKGKRLSIFELQKPDGWPEWLVKLMVKLLSSYGTRYEHTQRTPCNSIKKYFSGISLQYQYFGSVCIAYGVSEK